MASTFQLASSRTDALTDLTVDKFNLSKHKPVVGVILYENGPSCTFQAVPLGRASTPETANLAKGEMGEDV